MNLIGKLCVFRTWHSPLTKAWKWMTMNFFLIMSFCHDICPPKSKAIRNNWSSWTKWSTQYFKHRICHRRPSVCFASSNDCTAPRRWKISVGNWNAKHGHCSRAKHLPCSCDARTAHCWCKSIGTVWFWPHSAETWSPATFTATKAIWRYLSNVLTYSSNRLRKVDQFSFFRLLQTQYHYPSNAIQVKSSDLLQNDHFIDQLSILYTNKETTNRDYVTKW